MFDWNDEELSNIIWDGGGESDDHIVPYPEASEDLCDKEEWKKDASKIKLIEQKIPHTKIDPHGRKLGSSSNVDDGLMALWSELPTSKAAKTDEGTTESQVLSSESGSLREEIAQREKEAENCQNNQGKEHGDFVDYGWDNIGSFDDLDRIFSPPIFGNVSSDNSDELWSSKDASNVTTSISLNTSRSQGSLRSGHDVKAEYNRDIQPFAIDAGENGNPALCNPQNLQTLPDHLDYVAGTVKYMGEKPQMTPASGSSILTAENVLPPKEPLVKANEWKSRRKSRRMFQGKMPQDFYSGVSPSASLSGQFVNQLVPSGMQTTASQILRRQRQFQVADSLEYQNNSHSHVNPSAYGNVPHTYPAMHVVSSVQPGELRHHSLASVHEVHPSKGNLVKMPVNSYVKPITMTPQEKIEKLRKRQQMQAMLAIQKQQQQLNHQASCTNESFTHKSTQEQIYFSDGTDFDAQDMSTIPVLNPNTQIELDDYSTISASAADEYISEDTVLYRLQEIISKLDIKIRLCIRDSLFRLAQSATRRHCASDTSSTNKGKGEVDITAKDKLSVYSRYAGMSVNETETNSIDRTVALLLFHRPMDLSGNNPETHGSHISVKAAGRMNSALGCSQEDLICNCKQPFSTPGLKNACSLTESQHGDQFRNSSGIEISENASTSGPCQFGVHDVEAYNCLDLQEVDLPNDDHSLLRIAPGV